MKKLLSFLLAALMISVTTVTAFAEDTKAENTEEVTYSSLDEIKSEISNDLFMYDEYFFKYTMLFSMDMPSWSSKTSNNLKNTMKYVDSLYYNSQTIEEALKLKEQLENAVDDMCVDASELQWMLNYLKKDYESEVYYDEVTTANIKEIYEQAQFAYVSGDEKQIHISYVALRNLLNELCLYNKVPGDVNNDGKLTIDDVTLMQKEFASLIQLNSSQRYVAYSTKISTIDTVTNWQKDIINLGSYSVTLNKEFKKLDNTEMIDSNSKYEAFDYSTENDNYMYHVDRYYVLYEE